MSTQNITISIATTEPNCGYDLVLKPIKRKTKLGWKMFRSTADGTPKLWYQNPNNGMIYQHQVYR